MRLGKVKLKDLQSIDSTFQFSTHFEFCGNGHEFGRNRCPHFRRPGRVDRSATSSCQH